MSHFLFQNSISVTNNKGQTTIERVHVIHPTADTIEFYFKILQEIGRENASTHEIRMFDFENVRYIFNNRYEQFVRMPQYDELTMNTVNQIVPVHFGGVSDTEREAMYVFIC